MGWARGAQVLDEVWAEVVEFIPKKSQEEAAKRVVDIFLNYDADTISSESEYAVLRKVAKELLGYSDEEDEQDEDEEE
jgi:hypothetical protein